MKKREESGNIYRIPVIDENWWVKPEIREEEGER